MNQKVFIVLGSGSPRRKKLLKQAGLKFEVIVSSAEEIITKKAPNDVVLELSDQKCSAVVDYIKNTPECLKNADLSGDKILVIGADTVVSIDNKILGKPSDSVDACKMLMNLSGKTHEVFTGVSCRVLEAAAGEWQETDSFSFFSETKVHMYPFDESEAIDYISTKEPLDKAGAYGIQGIGERLVKSISGDYNNVVGFPLSRFIKELSERNYIDYEKI